MDVETEAIALARDVLDPRLFHVDEVDAGRELADGPVADRHVAVPTGAHAHRVELWLGPCLRTHARACDRVSSEVECHVVGVDDESVGRAGHVVRKHEVSGNALTALRALGYRA